MLYIYALTNIPLHNYTCTVTHTTDKEKNKKIPYTINQYKLQVNMLLKEEYTCKYK